MADASDIQRALQLLRNQKVSDAVALLERTVEHIPAHLMAHVLLARAYELRNAWEPALMAWEDAHLLMPTSPLVQDGRRRVRKHLDRIARDAETRGAAQHHAEIRADALLESVGDLSPDADADTSHQAFLNLLSPHTPATGALPAATEALEEKRLDEKDPEENASEESEDKTSSASASQAPEMHRETASEEVPDEAVPDEAVRDRNAHEETPASEQPASEQEEASEAATDGYAEEHSQPEPAENAPETEAPSAEGGQEAVPEAAATDETATGDVTPDDAMPEDAEADDAEADDAQIPRNPIADAILKDIPDRLPDSLDASEEDAAEADRGEDELPSPDLEEASTEASSADGVFLSETASFNIDDLDSTWAAFSDEMDAESKTEEKKAEQAHAEPTDADGAPAEASASDPSTPGPSTAAASDDEDESFLPIPFPGDASSAPQDADAPGAAEEGTSRSAEAQSGDAEDDPGPEEATAGAERTDAEAPSLPGADALGNLMEVIENSGTPASDDPDAEPGTSDSGAPDADAADAAETEDDASGDDPSSPADVMANLEWLRKQTDAESQRHRPQPEAPMSEPGDASDISDRTGDLDRLIAELESARITPDPTPQEAEDEAPDAPDLDMDLEYNIEDLVSETLGRIYAAQGRYREAARIYVKLAAQEPENARKHLERASELRVKSDAIREARDKVRSADAD